MSETLLSFCIATYRRYDVLKELIEHILSIDDDRIEVVVGDDKSDDGATDRLCIDIIDERLHVYINSEKMGSQSNIAETWDRGKGKYLFYINDRDYVDPFKIPALLSIIEELDKEGVAFASCVDNIDSDNPYRILDGKECFLEFAFRMTHPTGYIFRKTIWDNSEAIKKKMFYNQYETDYPWSFLCGCFSLKYKGALIYGDICEKYRERIDFKKVKSGYYSSRKDKRLWYTPEVQWRELRNAYLFAEEVKAPSDWKDELFIRRYNECFKSLTIYHKVIVSNPRYTWHYGIPPEKSIVKILKESLRGGLYLRNNVSIYLRKCKNNELLKELKKDTRDIIKDYFGSMI